MNFISLEVVTDSDYEQREHGRHANCEVEEIVKKKFRDIPVTVL
jgi:hypothetical protein